MLSQIVAMRFSTADIIYNPRHKTHHVLEQGVKPTMVFEKKRRRGYPSSKITCTLLVKSKSLREKKKKI